MGYGEIPSLPIHITFYSGNQPETTGNNSGKELNRNYTMMIMTSYTYLSV